ncbi:hypothetical protein MANES_14G138300v8 [Manihot esculenta]|uniref:Uncharacterized protein n=1 Tax=Manihot esculenta TaxID=3983 RepID=A0ACB7GIB1_MANES|nr:hypothetical protein MANES_14G138300v8 [Manihot esculenta]
MNGVLRGVESACRRRFHHSSGDSPDGAAASASGSTRSSFCLYTSNHEISHLSISSLQRSIGNQAYEDDEMGGLTRAARQAKERLDERLRTQRNSASKRHDTRRSVRAKMLSSKKNNGSNKKFSWAKLSCKAAE